MNSQIEAAGRFVASYRKKIPLASRATAFVILVCLCLIAIEVWQALHSYSIQREETETATTNLTQSVSQHAYDTFKEADAVLGGVVDMLEAEHFAGRDLQSFRPFLLRRAQDLPQLQSIYIFDADGNCVVNTGSEQKLGFNSAAREYFQFHLSHPDRSPHIGPPIRNYLSGDWVLTVSKRMNHADGSFAGVALAAINMPYFQAYYDRFNIGQHGAIFVALSNGTVLLRRPFDANILGKNVANMRLFHDYLSHAKHGIIVLQSGIDGITRINSYQEMNSFPLVVAVALSKEEVFTEWRSDTILHSIAVLILAIFLGWLGCRLVRQIELRSKVENDLQKIKNELETTNLTLEKLAMQDGLTGLVNRRQFDICLSNEFNRALRNNSVIAMIMIDVDYFKHYNDQYGHLAGDECLKAISNVINNSKKRPGDIAARYGGEEMVVLLPETDLAGAVTVAETIRQEIYALGLAHIGTAFNVVTISAGVEAFVPLQCKHQANDLIAAADLALYTAKASGRNCVFTTRDTVMKST